MYYKYTIIFLFLPWYGYLTSTLVAGHIASWQLYSGCRNNSRLAMITVTGRTKRAFMFRLLDK